MPLPNNVDNNDGWSDEEIDIELDDLEFDQIPETSINKAQKALWTDEERELAKSEEKLHWEPDEKQTYSDFKQSLI